jgi:lipase (class 3)
MAFTPGFVASEAENLVAINGNMGATPPPLQTPPLPSGWTLVFDSQQFGPFQNRWQLWQTTVSGQYAVVIRGTVLEAGSVIEDLLSVMIPASGSVTLDSISLSYQFAADPLAAIHLGFALGTLYTLFDIEVGILPILLENVPAGSDVFIAGHSQGAAEATLVRSYLAYPNLLTSVLDYQYKTYAFAQPKPGNDHYGWDFEAVASNSGLGFRVANDQDWVPQVPFTFELPWDINTPNPASVLTQAQLQLGTVAADLEALRGRAAAARLAQYQPHIAALAEVAAQQKLVKTAPAPAGSDISIVKTLDFLGCGWEVALQGTPGTNPDDPTDGFWQHHAAMYYDLLQKQFSG